MTGIYGHQGRTLLNAAKQKESDAQIINRYLETDVIPEYDKAEHSLMENDLNTIKGQSWSLMTI